MSLKEVKNIHVKKKNNYTLKAYLTIKQFIY